MNDFHGKHINAYFVLTSAKILICSNVIEANIPIWSDDIHSFRQWIDDLDDSIGHKKFEESNLSPYAPDDWLPEDDLDNNLLGC